LVQPFLKKSDTNNWIVNYLILLAKHFLHQSESDTSDHSFSYLCQKVMVVEEVIATIINKQNVDIENWQVYKHTF